MTVIYGLRCPLSNDIRYIGKANDPAKRFALHVRNAPTARHHCGKWIASLLKQGLRPSLEILHVVGDGESWEEAEIRLIAEYRAAGAPLTNMMDGGQGWKNGHPEILERMRESLRRTMSAPEMRDMLSRRVRALFKDPDYRAKHAAGRTKYLSSPDVRAKMSADARKQAARPGAREAMSEGARRAWEKLRASMSEEEYRREICERRSRDQKLRFADPERRAAALAALQSPEAKAKRYANRDGDPAKVAARMAKRRATIERKKAQAAQQ